MSRVVLIRHASAGERADWAGDDGLRPLDEQGAEQARVLGETLSERAIPRILSSPAVRCIDTVAPLAELLGLQIEVDEALAEGASRAAALGLLQQVDRGAALCTHGDVLAELLGVEEGKGAARVVEVAGDRVRVVEEV